MKSKTNLDLLTPAQLEGAIKLIKAKVERDHCEQSLYEFVLKAWDIVEPGEPMQENWHIKTLCGYIQAFYEGRIPNNRLIVNIPPGCLKSLLFGVFGPAWVWTRWPEKRFLCISNAQDLAVRDALRTKKLVTSDWYQERWPLIMTQDQNEKTLYVNEKGGHRQSQGIDAANTGKRGDFLVLDDPHDMAEIHSDVIRKGVLDTYDQSLSTRINNPETSGIVLIMQRGHFNDLTGHLLSKVKKPWAHLKIPMMYKDGPTFDAGNDIGQPELNDPRTKKGELMFAKRFDKAHVESLMEDLGEYGTASQLQQDPLPESGGIIKKHYWRIWPDDIARPKFIHVFHSYDTAFSDKHMKDSAFSAMTRWGIFWNESRDRYCVMCLGRWFDRLNYDALRAKVKEEDKKHNPDINLVEQKATGISIIQDLRNASPGRVKAYNPGKGEDKVSRAHSVSPLFQSGIVYIPNKAWAIGCKEKKITGLIDYVAMFPAGDPPVADLTDTVTQALIYMRSAQWLGDMDEDKELPYEEPRRSEEYYEDYEENKPKRRYYS